MKPTLIVEGEVYPVQTMTFSEDGVQSVGITKDGAFATFFNANINTEYFIEQPLKLDFKTALQINDELTEKFVEGIKRKIEAHEEIICDMSTDFVQAFREARKAPFANDSLLEQADLIEKLGYVVDGLHEALGVILMQGGENQ